MAMKLFDKRALTECVYFFFVGGGEGGVNEINFLWTKVTAQLCHVEQIVQFPLLLVN